MLRADSLARGATDAPRRASDTWKTTWAIGAGEGTDGSKELGGTDQPACSLVSTSRRGDVATKVDEASDRALAR